MRHAGQPDTGTAQPARVELRVVELMNRLLDVTSESMDAEIQAALTALGETYGFARTFLFRYSPTTGYTNTHEWVNSGVPPLKPLMQGGPQVVRPAWHQAFVEGRVVSVLDRNNLPSGSPERQFLTDNGIESTLMVPLCDGNRLFGVIGFDCCRPDRHWQEDAVFLLTSVGRAVSSVLLRVEAARTEADLRNHLAATLQALPDLVIELSLDGKVIACHSDKLPWLSSLVRAGIGRHVAKILPLPLAEVMTEILASPPMVDGASLTRRVGASTLVAPHRYEVSAARIAKCQPDQVSNLIVVIRDIAASDRSSAMTSFREGQFTAFFEMCPHPILVNDFDTGVIIDVNRAFKDIFGLDPGAGINLQVQQILPEDGVWLIQGAKAAMRQAQTYGP
ncbi:MAG TPA: GAF domain-containing protein, partial [Tabrizicola sp.]|nr:GAF domain-containing protein [Tabrizicola sp.]